MNSPKRSQMTLRMNQDLDKRLEENAKAVGVSKNAYVLLLLNRAMKGERADASA